MTIIAQTVQHSFIALLHVVEIFELLRPFLDIQDMRK